VETLVDESAAVREEARASEDADAASAAVRMSNERNMWWCGSGACGCVESQRCGRERNERRAFLRSSLVFPFV
jgi:hypothetical protein